MTTKMQSKNGKLTFDRVDCEDDVWRWSIVTGYKDCQSFEEVLFSFDDANLPTDEQVAKMLELFSA